MNEPIASPPNVRITLAFLGFEGCLHPYVINGLTTYCYTCGARASIDGTWTAGTLDFPFWLAMWTAGTWQS